MKSPLIYLTLVKLKNQIKALLKTPSKLIYVLFMAAMLSLVVFSGNLGEDGLDQVRPVHELAALLNLLNTFLFVTTFVTGSSGNTSMFALSDVSLLFPSPISSKAILFYGLLRQMGTSLLLGLFLLFQYSWVHQLYGVGYSVLLLLILCYSLNLFLAQLCAMVVYVYTSNRENVGKYLKWFVYAAVFAVYILWPALHYGPQWMQAQRSSEFLPRILEDLGRCYSGPAALFFPVSGWTAAIASGSMTHFVSSSAFYLFPGPDLLLTGLLLTVLLTAVLVWLLIRCNNNYYEDAIQTAETAQSAITAKKEGQLGETAPKHVKLGKIGLDKGWGASALYYKHKIENRRSGVFFLSNTSLIFAVILIFSSLFMKELEEAAILSIFVMGTYLQIFSSALGRFNREMTKPYIYLLPEPPLKKMIHALRESLVSDCLEALLIFLPVGLLLQADPLDILCCIAARISFALLYTAGNMLVERVFGSVSSKAMILMFYFLALLLMAAPGIIVGILLMAATPLGHFGVFLGMTLLNIPISLAVLYLCRNLLQYAELNNR